MISEMKPFIVCLIFVVCAVCCVSATALDDDNGDLRGMIKILQVKVIVLKSKIVLVKIIMSTQSVYLHFSK